MVEFFMKLKEALSSGCLFAFNIDDFVILKAVLETADQERTPVITQLSQGEVNFWGIESFSGAISPWQNKGLNVFLNIDHGEDFQLLEQAVNLGFSMVHFDGSNLPWEENIAETKIVVEMAHQQGALVEGEPQQEWTDPQKAAEFVDQTGVDLLAVFAGNRHGMAIGEEERLDFSRLDEIKRAVGSEVFLTLHGGSGVAFEDLKLAVKEGLVSKINVNTLLRITYRQELEKRLKHYQGQKVYELLHPVKEALQGKIAELLELAG